MCFQVGKWRIKVVSFRWRFIKKEVDMENLESVLVVESKLPIMSKRNGCLFVDWLVAVTLNLYFFNAREMNTSI